VRNQFTLDAMGQERQVERSGLRMSLIPCTKRAMMHFDADSATVFQRYMTMNMFWNWGDSEEITTGKLWVDDPEITVTVWFPRARFSKAALPA